MAAQGHSILCSPVCQGQALDFLDSPCFNVPQGLHLENGCKCPCGKIVLIQRMGRMNRERGTFLQALTLAL